MTLIDGESNDSSKWDTRDNKQDDRLNSFHAVWDAASTPGSVLILAMSPFIIALHRGKDERGHVTLNKHLAFLKFCLYEVAAEHFIGTF